MPTADEHRRKAEHNLRFLETIDQDEFCDWMATVAFYAAVHMIERLRADINEDSQDHGDRLGFVLRQHLSIHSHFRELYNISLIVRYQTGSNQWLLPDRVLGHLEEIRVYVEDYFHS